MIKLKEILTEGTRRFFYHATTCEALPNIVARGLVPNDGDTTWGGDLGKFSEGKIFLTDQFNTAVYYGNAGIWKKEHHNRFKPLLRVRLGAMLLTPDPQSQHDFYSKVAVPGPFDLFTGEAWADDRGDIHPKNTALGWRPLTKDTADGIYHGEWDGEIIDDEDDELTESKSDQVWFGAIWPDETIRAIRTNDKHGRHPQEWQSCVKWRYVPEIEYLNWWEEPSKKEDMLVRDYIERRGYKIEHVNIYTARAVTENKELLVERASAKDLEAFLRAMIQGTEWAGKVFLVGGFVRDELLGKEPKDADIVVWKNQGGIEFNTWLAKKLNIYKDTNPVNTSNFGTSTLRLDGVVWNGIDFTGEMVDAVMFRKEQYHDPNSRKPTVQYTNDIKVDASRRDLTFNSLYKDISSGEVLDPTGKGKDDLKNKIIRTPIDPTLIYTDDALRMFRAVRFAAQLGFELSPEVVNGIKQNLHRLGNTSKERIRDELNKILVSKNAARGIRILRDTGLLSYVAKELQQAVGMTQNVHHTHDVFDHTLDVLEKTKPALIQRLMGLFHDIGKVVTRSETPTGVHFIGHEDAGLEIVERVMRELKYPNELIQAVKLGVANHMRLKQGGDEANVTDKTLRKFKIALGDQLENVLDVIHADNTSHADASSMPNQIARVRARLQTLDVQVKNPNLPINGNDLQAMGIKPGPMIGKILGVITDAWYDNPNITREEALAIVQKMI